MIDAVVDEQVHARIAGVRLQPAVDAAHDAVAVELVVAGDEDDGHVLRDPVDGPRERGFERRRDVAGQDATSASGIGSGISC